MFGTVSFIPQTSNTLRTRMRKNATAPENPIWIMVSVIGNGKLKYLGERTHCNKNLSDNKRLVIDLQGTNAKKVHLNASFSGDHVAFIPEFRKDNFISDNKIKVLKIKVHYDSS